MSRQTNRPLPDYRLNTTNRTAREIARGVVPDTDMNPPYQRGAVWRVLRGLPNNFPSRVDTSHGDRVQSC